MTVRNGLLLTADQIAEDLPPVLYLIVKGLANPVFPNTNRGAPSNIVVIQAKEPPPLDFRREWDGEQWNSVAVPVLREIQTWGWLGRPNTSNDILSLLQNLYGPGGALIFEEGEEWGTLAYTRLNPGLVYEAEQYTQNLVGIVRLTAQGAGY